MEEVDRMANEGDLCRKILKHLKHKYPNSFFYKVNGNGFQMKGIPDIIGCLEGTFIGLEVKLPKGSYGATELQLQRIKEIKKAGGRSAVVTSIEEVEDFIWKEVF